MKLICKMKILLFILSSLLILHEIHSTEVESFDLESLDVRKS